jgi:hypothetical protein
MEVNQMIYLYLKIHNQTGFKYLGKTVSKDPHLYKGSGKVWSRHIKKHGYDVTTIILLASEDDKEIAETGKFFSKIFGVVKSKEFANIREETGDGGDTWSTNPNKEETLSKILTRTRGQKRTDQQKKNISDALNRTNTSYSGHDTKNNATFTNKKHRNDTIEKIKISNRRFRDKSSKKNRIPEKSYNKGIPKTKEHKRKLSEALLGRKPSNSRIIVIDGKEFIGMKEASEFIGIPYSTIRNRIKSRNLHYANIYDKSNKKLVVDGRVVFEDELS